MDQSEVVSEVERILFARALLVFRKKVSEYMTELGYGRAVTVREMLDVIDDRKADLEKEVMADLRSNLREIVLRVMGARK